MRTTIFHGIIFIQLGFLLYSAASTRGVKGITDTEKADQQTKILYSSNSISTTKADITTPLPTIPAFLNPSTTSPTINPLVTNPDPMATPITTPATPSPFASGASWCVANQAATKMALQIALDYACSYGSTDCSPVQPDGSCYSPISVRDHASYAFNSYYQKNPIPTSCNFGGAAVITSTNPSYGTCQYPSTSTSSSVLDTSNASGSTVFGGGVPRPTVPNTSSAFALLSPYLAYSMCHGCASKKLPLNYCMHITVLFFLV